MRDGFVLKPSHFIFAQTYKIFSQLSFKIPNPITHCRINSMAKITNNTHYMIWKFYFYCLYFIKWVRKIGRVIFLIYMNFNKFLNQDFRINFRFNIYLLCSLLISPQVQLLLFPFYFFCWGSWITISFHFKICRELRITQEHENNFPLLLFGKRKLLKNWKKNFCSLLL